MIHSTKYRAVIQMHILNTKSIIVNKTKYLYLNNIVFFFFILIGMATIPLLLKAEKDIQNGYCL